MGGMDWKHWIQGSAQGEGFKDGQPPKRRRGRPVGSKDRKPRVKRVIPKSSKDSPTKELEESSGVRKKHWKIILSSEQAVDIYKKRPLGDTSALTCSRRSKELSEQYVVNSKTIRDIWNRTTWVKATHKYWTEEEELDYIQGQQTAIQVRSPFRTGYFSTFTHDWYLDVVVPCTCTALCTAPSFSSFHKHLPL